jgi:hypothetical protein
MSEYPETFLEKKWKRNSRRRKHIIIKHSKTCWESRSKMGSIWFNPTDKIMITVD